MFKKYFISNNLTKSQIDLVKKFNKSSNIKYEKISKCEICFSSNFNILFHNDRYGIKQNTCVCKNCGFIFSNPRMTRDSNKFFYESDLYRSIYEKQCSLDIFYSETVKELNTYKPKLPQKPNFKKYYSQLYFDFINDEISKYKTVLDIGCGKGKKIIDFNNIGKKTSGIELSRIFIEIHKIFDLDTSYGFIKDVNQKYDLIILSHVLEHLTNLKTVIEQLSAITNKYIFIEIPGHIKKFQSVQNAHNYYFSINTLNFFMLNNKFKLISLKYAKDNEFIFALYEKTINEGSFNFNKKKEIKLVNYIFKKYIIKFLIKKIMNIIGLKKFIK